MLVALQKSKHPLKFEGRVEELPDLGAVREEVAAKMRKNRELDQKTAILRDLIGALGTFEFPTTVPKPFK